MGWGTDFTADIYLNRILFSNRYQVEDKIDSLEEDKSFYENKLYMMVSSNVKDIVPRDWLDDDPITWLHKEIKDTLQELNNTNIELYKLRLYLEFLEQNKNVRQKRRSIKERISNLFNRSTYKGEQQRDNS